MNRLRSLLLVGTVTLSPQFLHAGGTVVQNVGVRWMDVAQHWNGAGTMINSPTFAFMAGAAGNNNTYWVSVSEVGIEKYEKIFSMVEKAIMHNRRVEFQFDVATYPAPWGNRNEVDDFTVHNALAPNP